eukprot:scaffold31813_cov62-Phaeocystis_antarctica.AAC.4
MRLPLLHVLRVACGPGVRKHPLVVASVGRAVQPLAELLPRLAPAKPSTCARVRHVSPPHHSRFCHALAISTRCSTLPFMRAAGFPEHRPFAIPAIGPPCPHRCPRGHAYKASPHLG